MRMCQIHLTMRSEGITAFSKRYGVAVWTGKNDAKTISVDANLFHSDFPFPCFDLPKASNFISGGVQNRETKNSGLGTIVTSIQDSKPREKQISPTFSYFLINNALLYHFLAN